MEEKEEAQPKSCQNSWEKPPNQQRTLNKLPTDPRCRNFANKRQLRMQVGGRSAETCTQGVQYIPTDLTTVGGWASK